MQQNQLRPGDIVIDRANNAPLQAVRIDPGPAVEHEYVRDDPKNWMFGDLDTDRVVWGVFLPTPDDGISAPSKAYCYPESRMLRYPVEWADMVTAPYRTIVTGVLEDIFVEAHEVHDTEVGMIEHVARGVLEDEIVDDALDLAQSRVDGAEE